MVKKINKKKQKALKIPIWVMDGFNGILGFVIYNFFLYLSGIAGIGGLIGRIRKETGYFYLNTFVDFEFSKTVLVILLVSSFLFAFLLGTGIAKIVRKLRKCPMCL